MNIQRINESSRKLEATETVYYPWFDWLRAILAITVMLGHDGLITWSHSGDLAVKIFFALSGWLIGGLLMHTRRDQLSRFYFNRAVRIWVPYYLALALLLAASLIREPVTQKWIEFVFYKLTFVYNWFGTTQLATSTAAMPLRGTGNHFWSVNAEEQFYLLAPLLLVVLPSRWGRSVVVWALVALVAWVSRQYAAIVMGVLAAVIANTYPGFLSAVRARGLVGAVALLTVLAISAGYAYDLMAPVLSVCLVLLLAVQGTRRTPGVIAGGMSYPLYLNHWIGVFAANAVTKPFALQGSVASHVLSSALNIAIAIALYWYVDRRLLQHRNRWYTVQRGVWVTRIAYFISAVGMLVGLVLLRAD
jgi:peptidoglycan/LPS O-acetylase OafA/YrhL